MSKSSFRICLIGICLVSIGGYWFVTKHDIRVGGKQNNAIRTSSPYLKVENSLYTTGKKITLTPLPPGSKWIQQPEGMNNLSVKFSASGNVRAFLSNKQNKDINNWTSVITVLDETGRILGALNQQSSTGSVDDWSISSNGQYIVFNEIQEVSSKNKDQVNAIYLYDLKSGIVKLVLKLPRNEFLIKDISILSHTNCIALAMLKRESFKSSRYIPYIYKEIDFDGRPIKNMTLNIPSPDFDSNNAVIKSTSILPKLNELWCVYFNVKAEALESFMYAANISTGDTRLLSKHNGVCTFIPSIDGQSYLSTCVSEVRLSTSREVSYHGELREVFLRSDIQHEISFNNSIIDNVVAWDKDKHVAFFWAGKDGKIIQTKDSYGTIGIYAIDTKTPR